MKKLVAVIISISLVIGSTTMTNASTIKGSEASKNDVEMEREANLKWYAVSKEIDGWTAGEWMYAGAATLSGGVLSASHSNIVSNTFSGELKVSYRDLEALIGFNTVRTWETTVSYSTPNLPHIAGKAHRLMYRNKYIRYKVRQELKYTSNSTLVKDVRYVYPREWKEYEYKVEVYNV